MLAPELISSFGESYDQRERLGSRVPLKAITHSISDELNSSRQGSVREGSINPKVSKIVKIVEKQGDLQDELITLGAPVESEIKKPLKIKSK